MTPGKYQLAHVGEEWQTNEGYQETILKRDTVYFLGDICFTEDSLKIIKNLVGRKILIMGNHDAQHFNGKLLWDAFDNVLSLIKEYG